jgi:hypothetical protein
MNFLDDWDTTVKYVDNMIVNNSIEGKINTSEDLIATIYAELWIKIQTFKAKHLKEIYEALSCISDDCIERGYKDSEHRTFDSLKDKLESIYQNVVYYASLNEIADRYKIREKFKELK